MNTYLTGTAVSLEVSLLTESGDTFSFTPDTVSYVVRDGEGDILADVAQITGYSGEGVVSVEVGSSVNTLSQGSVRDVRMVEFTCSLGDQKEVVRVMYIIEVPGSLEIGKNSYQTFQNAELLASEIPNLNAWAYATRSQKIAALIEARERIGRINLYPFRGADYDDKSRVSFPDDDAVFSDGSYGGINSVTQAQLATLPARFVNAIRKAQVAEANFILDDNSAEHKSDAGLLSEKIGESEQTFAPNVRKARSGICKSARSYLATYIVNSVRLGRG